MAINLLDFIGNVRQLAKQALGTHAGTPESGGFPRWVHVALHCLRIEEGYTYAELIDRLRLMPAVCEELGLLAEALPDPSALWHSFQRYRMWIWRQLLRVAAQQLSPSWHAALDSTFFERGHASQHYRQRSDRDIQTLKVTTLTDTATLAVLDVHCAARWRHDTRTGPRLVRRNTDELQSVAADKAFQDWLTEFEYLAHGIDPLILHRGSTPLTVGHNAAIRETGYSQRWMAETSYSGVKRPLGEVVGAQAWYRQFREIVLMFAVYNIERISRTL